MPRCFQFDSEALSYETRTPQVEIAVLALIVPNPPLNSLRWRSSALFCQLDRIVVNKTRGYSP